jgi:hypothetical protein
MTRSTLSRLAIVALLPLAACDGPDTGGATANAGGPDPGSWRLSSGKTPTKAEFAALEATCQSKGGAVDSCLSDLGLKRAR